MKTNKLSGCVITALSAYIILYRYKCIHIIIITQFFTGVGNMRGTNQYLIKNPSVMKSYSNSLTYVLNAVETR